MSSFKQAHGATGTTVLNGLSQTLSLTSSLGTPCSAGAHRTMPQAASNYSRDPGSPPQPPRPHTGQCQRPLVRASLDLSLVTWPFLLGRLPRRTLTGLCREQGMHRSRNWYSRFFGHCAHAWPQHVVPKACVPPPHFPWITLLCITSSSSARLGVLSRWRALTALPPSRPTVTPDWQRSPSLVTIATSLLVSLLLQMSSAKKTVTQPCRLGCHCKSRWTPNTAGNTPSVLSNWQLLALLKPLSPDLTWPQDTASRCPQRGDRNRAHPAPTAAPSTASSLRAASLNHRHVNPITHFPFLRNISNILKELQRILTEHSLVLS